MSYSSYFNPNIIVDRTNWAVTMVCNSESSGRPGTSSFGNNHAVLVVESVKKTGELFRQIIHLTGPGSHQEPNEVIFKGGCCFAGMLRIGNVLISKRNVSSVSYTHKSETWMRSADKVRIMRREAKQERDNPSANPRPFSILGNRSILTKDLETFKITDPLISSIANCDKDLFMTLYEITKRVKEDTHWRHPGENEGIERLKYHYCCPRYVLGFLCFDIARNAVSWMSHYVKPHDVSFSEVASMFRVNYLFRSATIIFAG